MANNKTEDCEACKEVARKTALKYPKGKSVSLEELYCTTHLKEFEKRISKK